MDVEQHRILILGGGRGGSAFLEMLLEEAPAAVVGMVDPNPDAPGMVMARKHDIPTYEDAEHALDIYESCTAFNLTGKDSIDELAGSRLGAGKVIGGMEARLIWSMVTRLHAAKEELRQQATTDLLTSAYNRRYLMERLHEDVIQAIRYKASFSIVLIDLDHFKDVNDTHGHDAGDAVLKRVTDDLHGLVRRTDILGRWGGEEFLVLLSHTNEKDATVAARHWLKEIRSRPVSLPSGKSVTVTFSAGVVSYDGSDGDEQIEKTIERLVAVADERLYKIKAAGRNGVKGSGK